MKNSSMLLKRCVTVGALVPFVSLPLVARGALDDVVLLWGSANEGPEQAELGVFGAGRYEEVCQRVNGVIGLTLWAVVDMLPADISLPTGLPTGNVLLDCSDPRPSGAAYFIFSTCSMTMGQGPYWMRWTVPPLASEASMAFVDPETGLGYEYPLETAFDELTQEIDGQEAVPLGDMVRFQQPSGAGTGTVTLDVFTDGVDRAFTPREYTTRTYEFSYEGSLSLSGAGVALPLRFGRIESEGVAEIAADAPGADVIAQFYANFANNVLPHTGASSLYGGMMAQMAAIAERGIAVRTSQTNSGGLASMFGGGTIGAESSSTSTIERIMILPGAAEQTCGSTVFPEDMEVVDLSEQMEESRAAMDEAMESLSAEDRAMLEQMGSAGDLSGILGGGVLPADVFGGAEEGAGQAGQMTPEQRAAMQQVSGMLNGLLGGAAAAAAGGAPNAAAAGAGGAAPAVARPQGPSLSSALMTDDLAQSAQNMLEALGYDTGNTDGELSVEMTIAISQFQAERGMEVTGEVTPQLVGVLAAAVDAL